MIDSFEDMDESNYLKTKQNMKISFFVMQITGIYFFSISQFSHQTAPAQTFKKKIQTWPLIGWQHIC